VTLALNELSDRYLALHTRKEELFWSTRMGIAEGTDARRQASDAENAWQAFLQDPDRLASIRDLEARAAPRRPSPSARRPPRLCHGCRPLPAGVLPVRQRILRCPGRCGAGR